MRNPRLRVGYCLVCGMLVSFSVIANGEGYYTVSLIEALLAGMLFGGGVGLAKIGRL